MTYEDWLEDMGYEDTEERQEEYFDTHCQFCGGDTAYGPCGCDHELRY